MSLTLILLCITCIYTQKLEYNTKLQLSPALYERFDVTPFSACS